MNTGLKREGISHGQEDDSDHEQEQIEIANYTILRDALSGPIIQQLALPASTTATAVVSPTTRKRPHPRRKREHGRPNARRTESREQGIPSARDHQANEDDIDDLIGFTDVCPLYVGELVLII